VRTHAHSKIRSLMRHEYDSFYTQIVHVGVLAVREYDISLAHSRTHALTYTHLTHSQRLT